MRDSTSCDRLIVTIDGPAGSGKSTIARRLAKRLGIAFLDTGAMYRAIAASALDSDIDPANFEAVNPMADQLRLRFNWDDDPPTLKVDGRDITHRLRDGDVTRAVSDIAANPHVRQVLVRAQRWIGNEHRRLVTEGRDQGSVVFRDAEVKFYLDASPEVRARRRTLELQQAGREADQQQILQQIVYRDQRDRSRTDGPLVCPDGAIVVDTSDMTLDEVEQALFDHVQRKAGKGTGG